MNVTTRYLVLQNHISSSALFLSKLCLVVDRCSFSRISSTVGFFNKGFVEIMNSRIEKSLSAPIIYQKSEMTFEIKSTNFEYTSSMTIKNCIFRDITANMKGTIYFKAVGDLSIMYTSFIRVTSTYDYGWDFSSGGVLMKECNSFIVYSSCFDEPHSSKSGSINVRAYECNNNYVFINNSLFMNTGKKGYCVDMITSSTVVCVHRDQNSTNLQHGRAFWVDKVSNGPADVMYIKTLGLKGDHLIGFNMNVGYAIIKNLCSINDTCSYLFNSISSGSIYVSDSTFSGFSTSTFFTGTGIMVVYKCIFDKSIVISKGTLNSFGLLRTQDINQVDIRYCGLASFTPTLSVFESRYNLKMNLFSAISIFCC